MEITNVIDAQTGAAESAILSSRSSGNATLVVTSGGGDLVGDEVVNIEYTTDSGKSWKEMTISGTVQRLDVDNNIITVTVPVMFKVSKSETASSVGVSMIS